LGILIGAPFVEGHILTRLAEMGKLDQTGDLSLMKYFQMVTQVGMFIAPPLLFAFLVDQDIWRFFYLKKFPTIGILLLGLLLMAVANPVNDWLVYQNNLIHLPESFSAIEQWMRSSEEKAAELTNTLLQMNNWQDYAINLLMIGVFAALGEELLFRGVLQPVFLKITKNPHAAIWITAFIFSSIHMQFYGFFARMFAGAILGYLYYYTQNLWVPILAHFFNNAMAVSFVYFTNTPLYATQLNFDEPQPASALNAFIAFVVIVIGLFWLNNWKERKQLRDSE